MGMDGKFVSAEPLDIDKSKLTPQNLNKLYEITDYNPSDEVKLTRQMIIKHFTLGYTNMYTPRVEFNDLCTIDRMQVDEMSWNTYQPNNGWPVEGDVANAWKSRAIKPIVRNKSISIAAHALSRLYFPKVFARNQNSDFQKDSAEMMRYLMEYAAENANYANTSMRAVITSLYSPASIVYKEYAEVYRQVKRERQENGKYRTEDILDKTLSGFRDVPVPVDQLYIENFYEPDIQKQGWLIWRKVYSYSLGESLYGEMENWKYVRPGVQCIYNDANQSFYNVYDPNMRQYDVEEVVYFNRNLDLKIIMVNGIMITEPDNANPRQDKMYPFVKFGYELINDRCFYYKSLAFKLMQDANIINTLYPMIIDGTYLNIMPPMVNVGGEEIGASVIIPGAVTTLTDKDADLRVIQNSSANGLRVGMETMLKVDESLNASSEDPLQSGTPNSGTQTAYEISRLEQNAATVLGLYIKMIREFVLSYGQLAVGDIIQYLTILDADKITDNPELVYKTFLINAKPSANQMKNNKIVFTNEVPEEPMTEEEALEMSYKNLKEQGGVDSDTTLFKSNPKLFRELIWALSCEADVLNPPSDELTRAFDLEQYDRLVQNPLANQEEALRLLLSTNPTTKKDPDKYVSQPQLDPMAAATAMAQGQPSATQAGNSPLNAIKGKTPLPQTMPSAIPQ